MARQSSAFDLAWSSLSGVTEEAGWRMIPIDPAGAIEIHAGRLFPGNEEAVLASFPSASLPTAEKLPDGQGFAVERADPYNDGRAWLALTRRPHGSPELFTAMACDVIGAVDAAVLEGADAPRLVRVFLGRVKAWQEFMRKGAQALSPEAEIGLFGELATLLAIMDAGVAPETSVEGWVGPLDAVQDFELGTGAVEVKSTIAAAGFPARIGSLEQLDDSVRQPLFVAAAHLRQVAAGLTLPDMVETLRLRAALHAEAARVLSERLIAAGYFDAHAERYVRRFETESIRLIEVTSGFPRLIHATVPPGVTRAVYDVDLDKAGGLRLDFAAALRCLGVI
jgi:hypothetical protein